MKKNIIIAAAAILALGMTACEPEIINPAENGPVATNGIKTTEDLHGTNWTYSMTYSEFIYQLTGMDLGCVEEYEEETYEFGLNFDGTYAHFSFPDNVMAFGGDEGELDQIYGVSYTYSYDGTTHTGYLDGVAENDEGEDVPVQLQFTYDDVTDVITFVLPMYFADENETPVSLTLNFHRDAE